MSSFSIAALAVASLSVSCKKESKVTAPGTGNNSPGTTGIISGKEAGQLVNEVNSFMAYLEKYVDDPHNKSRVITSDDLPAAMSPNEALRYIENVYNFVYAKPDPELVNNHLDTISVTLTKNAAGQLELASIADGFLSSFYQLKADFQTLGTQPSGERTTLGDMATKTLSAVDVSITKQSSSSVSMLVVGSFATGRVPLPTTASSTAGVKFDATESWRIYDDTDRSGTPTKLEQYIKKNWGGVFGAEKNSYKYTSPILVVIYGKHPEPGFNPICTVSNPLYALYPCVPDYRLLFDSFQFYHCLRSNMLPGYALNYYLEQIPLMLKSGEYFYKKSLVNIDICEDMWTPFGGSSYNRFITYDLFVTLADLVKIPPTSTIATPTKPAIGFYP